MLVRRKTYCETADDEASTRTSAVTFDQMEKGFVIDRPAGLELGAGIDDNAYGIKWLSSIFHMPMPRQSMAANLSAMQKTAVKPR